MVYIQAKEGQSHGTYTPAAAVCRNNLWKNDQNQQRGYFHWLMRTSAVLVLLLWSAGCGTTMHLSPEETWHRKIEVTENNGEETLSLSGLCSHSAWGIDQMVLKEQGDKLTFSILLKPQKSGSFNYNIGIEKKINYIYWDAVMIWKRGQGVIPVK